MAFPLAPTIWDTHTDSSGRTWEYVGNEAWIIQSSGSSSGDSVGPLLMSSNPSTGMQNLHTFTYSGESVAVMQYSYPGGTGVFQIAWQLAHTGFTSAPADNVAMNPGGTIRTVFSYNGNGIIANSGSTTQVNAGSVLTVDIVGVPSAGTYGLSVTRLT